MRGARLVEHRTVYLRHVVRARVRPRQAFAAGRALHRPGHDHEDRRPGRAGTLAAGVGVGASGDRQADREGQEDGLRGGEAALFRVPRTAGEFPGARSGLRVRQLPVSLVALSQGLREAGHPRRRSAGIAAAVSPGGSGSRARDRGESLRRGAGAGHDLDR